MKQTAIVIGRADAIKLGLIRSLGEYGCNVISIHLVPSYKVRSKPIDYYCKYVSHYYFSTSDDLIRLLVEKCSDSSCKPVLFPLDDKSVYLTDEAYDQLKELFLIPNVGHREKGVISLMDKFRQKELARKAGLKVPKGWIIPYINGNFEIPEDIEFPCFVKGLSSYNSAKAAQKKCDTRKDLLAFLDYCRLKSPHSLLVEKALEIDKEVGFIALSDGSNFVIPAKVELLEMGEGSSHGISYLAHVYPIDINESHHRLIGQLIREIGFVGILNFDFIESNGDLFFVEINFRYAAYGYAVHKAGVNLPALCVNMMSGANADNIPTVIDHDVVYFNEKIAIKGVIERHLSWKKYFRLSKSADCPLVASSDDPSPYRHFMWRSFRGYLKSLVKNKER